MYFLKTDDISVVIIIIIIKRNIQICSKHCTIKYKAIYDVLKLILIIINTTVKLTFR